MHFIHKMESVLITITGALCIVLLIKLLYKLRTILVWRVNCWFCNNNFWVKFPQRNCWSCPNCEQYNGFTKDGDYNKPLLLANDQAAKSSKVFKRSPPRNGLCKMCNINQQLKVAQLANFVPMHEINYNEEIELYKGQLEKAYKLCSPCKKVLQVKLHKEKEFLLGSKLLETRSPKKMGQRPQRKALTSFLNYTSMTIASALFILVSAECYNNVLKYDNVSSAITNIKDIFCVLFERIVSIVKMKTELTFPSYVNYVDYLDVNYFDLTQTDLYLGPDFVDSTQKLLAGLVCLIQIIGHLLSVNQFKYSFAIDLLWTVFVLVSLGHKYVGVAPVILSFVKLCSVMAVLLVYKSMNKNNCKRNISRIQTTPRKIKNLINGKVSPLIDDDEPLDLDTDDDVSLSKFGLHNLTDSSSENVMPLNSSLMSGRTFTPRTGDSIWSKPKHNSTFCVNSVVSKSPSSISDTVFIKPSFNKYQKLAKDDSDSELDESISTLCIGSPKKAQKSNSIFSLRKFNATPNFLAPSPMSRSRPLISPSKLGHSTSWVAGGYWGSEGERQVFNLNGSRSSSQSSGFESQASSMTQRNVFSQPPSREESVCGDPDRTTMLLDRFQNCNMSNFGSYQSPQSFGRVTSPVFPQMQYNSHVHIPQARLGASFAPPPHSVYSQQPPYSHSGSMFKAPGGSGLIKLPQDNSSFVSH